MSAKNIPKYFLNVITFIFTDIPAPTIAPNTPATATGIPTFQFINLLFIVVIIAAIDVGIKNTRFVPCAVCWFTPHEY